MSSFLNLPSTQSSDEYLEENKTEVQSADSYSSANPSVEGDPNMFQQAQEWVSENVLGQEEGALAAAREAGIESQEAATQQIAEDDRFGTEIAKGVFGAPKNLATKVAGAAEFTGDVVGGVADAAGLVERDASDIPWSEQYEYAQYDLGSAQTNTWYGGLVQEALAFAMGGGAVGGATRAVGLGAKASTAVAFGSDFVLDYFSSAEGGNLSNLIQDGPLRNNLSAALAHNAEDNSHWRRFKNALEGAIPSAAVVGVSRWYKGLRAGKAAKAAGATPQKATEIAQSVAKAEPDEAFASAAKAENTANSGRPPSDLAPEGKPAQYDPQDRVSQVDKTDMNESAASFWDSPEAGGGRSVIDEVDVQTIKTQAGLRDFIQARIPDVDVEEISRRLGRQDTEYVNDVLSDLAQFAKTGDIEALEPLRFANTQGIKGVDAGGAVVLDTLVKSVGDRLSVLSKEVATLTELDAPFKTQATQLLDRAEALVRLKKEATQFSSKNLLNWSEVPLNLRRAIDADNAKITKIFDELRSQMNSTDPVDFVEFKQNMGKMGMAFAASKGDPRLQMAVIEGIARVGFKQVNSVFINSVLSGPLTHARNIGGNTVAMGERIFSRAIGGEGMVSFRALDGLGETLMESFAIGKQSFSSPHSIVTDSSKVADYVLQDRRVIENAANAAKTKGEKAAVNVALNLFDFHQNPWFTWPGKALQAGDDLTKSVLARMELRFEAAKEAADYAKNMKPGDSLKSADEFYRALKDQKLSPSGKILDHDLLDIADSASFQRALTGNAKAIGSNIQSLPGGRLVMPFYKTGHNISRYAVQLSPLAPLSSEFREVMEFGTEAQKAVMRGRMATGYLTVGTTMGLASADLITGFGPPPGKEREDWLKDHEPNSVRIGDKWVSYQAIPGFSLVMSTVADITMMTGKMTEGDAAYVLGAAPFFVANAVTSQPMFQGFVNMAEILDFRSLSPDKFIESAGGFANDLVGGSGLRRSLENALSTNMSDYKNWAEATIGKLSGGILGEKIERIDVLTGKPMPTKYANPLNLINPFTVVGDNKSPLLDSLGEIDYPIGHVIPLRVAGVKLKPAERELLGKAIHAEGEFPKALQKVLGSKKFWARYESWQQDRRDGIATPKEEARWYQDLNTIVSKYRQAALRELRYGKDPVSEEYRESFPARAAGLDSGRAGDLDPSDQSRIREINELANFGKT